MLAVEAVHRVKCYTRRLTSGDDEGWGERLEGDISNVAHELLLRVARGKTRLRRSEDLAPLQVPFTEQRVEQPST